jgi:hypothetical protein
MSEGQRGGPESADWVRGPKKGVDLTNVPTEKIRQAAGRGVRIDLTTSVEGKRIADVTKVAVEGMPAPKKPLWKRLFGID